MRTIRFISLFLFLIFNFINVLTLDAEEIRFIYCSDLHYGIKRNFRGKECETYKVVDDMLKSFTLLYSSPLPSDGGAGAGTVFGEPDFLICTGDISNRMQKGAWTASESWNQFKKDWIDALDYPVYVVPGNHDISNAIGYPKRLSPERDDASAVGIFNHNMPMYGHSEIEDFNYPENSVRYSFVRDSLRFMFIGMWPDGNMRMWMDSVMTEDPVSPVIIFTHDPVEADAKHYTNPNYPYNINAVDKFENLLSDTCSVDNINKLPEGNWSRFERFVESHPQIKAYFHGDCNYNEFYEWKGVNGTVSLPVFRVDSPMKGEYSSKNENLLSYQVVCIDTDNKIITVRECLWNKDGLTSITWGEVKTISYK